MKEIVSILSGCLSDLGVEVGKQYIKDIIDKKTIKKALQDYIECQRKYHDFCSLAGEFDFQGLVDYVKEFLLSDVEKRIFSVRSSDRKLARENVIAKAVAYSRATTNESRANVAKLMAISLDIIHEFYEKKITKKEYILAAEIVDAVSEDTARIIDKRNSRMEAALTETNSRLKQIESQTSLLAEDNPNSIFSIDKAIRIAENEGFEQIENECRQLFNHLSVNHPLYPNYGYTWENGKFQSIGLKKDAERLYPPKFIFSGAVRAENKILSISSEDPFDYAYRHQLQLIMDVKDAKKYLGDQLDPVQNEMYKFVGCELRAMPPPFPPAFPCALKVDEKTFFDYILLRTQEILDDGTFVIGNKEQSTSHIYFEIRLNPKKKNADFSIKLNNANNNEFLNAALFKKALIDRKTLHIYVLNAGTDMMTGIVNQVNYNTGFNSIVEEIDFLKRICAIENYFNVSLNLKGDIFEDEYQLMIHVSEMVMNNKAYTTWNETTFTGTTDDNLREKLAKMDDRPCVLSYTGNRKIKLFGTNIEFPFIRTYNCAIMTDIERIQKLVQFLRNDDNIQITFRPGDDRTVIESLIKP